MALVATSCGATAEVPELGTCAQDLILSRCMDLGKAKTPTHSNSSPKIRSLGGYAATCG